MVRYVLPDAVRDTVTLLAGVGVLAASLGTGTAWLVTAYDFPGRRALVWALLLPLAVPTYIVAYAYLDLLHPVGPVQSVIRAVLGYDSPREFRLPDVRSMAGCIVLLGFVLYPYVYLPVRAMFLMQSANLLDVARTLGLGQWGLFARVAVPLARPAIAVGLSLTLMEALNDIGASEFLGVRTLTVSIYATWVTRSDLAGAALIAVVMLIVVLGLVIVEQAARRRRGYASDAQHPRPLEPRRLRGARALVALAFCLVPVLIGFAAPAGYLLHAAVERIRYAGISAAIVRETVNTVLVSGVATALTITCGVLVVYAARLSQARVVGVLTRVASLGYAVPGTVLAIGILPVVSGIEGGIDGLAGLIGASTGVVLIGSGAALVYAYTARFLTIATGAVEAGFIRIAGSLDAAARTLGETPGGRLRRLYIPLTRPALATAAILVLVDCMKELPATLLLRPLGFDTLATHLYGEAVRGTYEDAAIAALLIVAMGLVPVILISSVGAGVGTVTSRGRARQRERRGPWSQRDPRAGVGPREQ